MTENVIPILKEKELDAFIDEILANREEPLKVIVKGDDGQAYMMTVEDVEDE